MRDQGIGPRPPRWDGWQARDLLLSASGVAIFLALAAVMVGGIMALWLLFPKNPDCYPGGLPSCGGANYSVVSGKASP